MGVILLTIIAEFGGRKPAVAVIIIMTVTASSLSIPETKPYLELVHITTSLASGGLLLLYVCLAEYSEPKYRLVFSITNITLNRTGYVIGKLIYLYLSEVFEMRYVRFLEIFLATLCFASLLAWPESPYWLASKNKQYQSKKSFSMLRREKAASEKEFNDTLECKDRSYSFQLYVFPISKAMLLFSIFWCSIIFQNKQLTLWWIPDYPVEYQAVMECLTLFVLYKTIRYYYRYGSIVIILLIFISVTFQYAFVILFYIFLSEDMTSDDFFLNISMTVLFSISYVLVIVGPTTLSISKFAVHVPLKRRSMFICILGLCFFVVKIIYRYLAIFIEERFGYIVTLLLLTTIMAFGTVLSCYFVHKVKGKTLIEIEQVYLSK